MNILYQTDDPFKCSYTATLFFYKLTRRKRALEDCVDSNGTELALENNKAAFVRASNHTFVVYKMDDKIYIAQSWTNSCGLPGFNFRVSELQDGLNFLAGRTLVTIGETPYSLSYSNSTPMT